MTRLRWYALAGATTAAVFVLWLWIGYESMMLLGEVLR